MGPAAVHYFLTVFFNLLKVLLMLSETVNSGVSDNLGQNRFQHFTISSPQVLTEI
jgi:hypothetical protein